MNATVLKLIFLFLATLGPQGESKPQAHLDMPKGMKQYFIGFLVHGEKWSQTPPQSELDQLMQRHLAYIRLEVETGKYALAGPFLDHGRISGLLVINAASAEEAKQIVSGDPMVQSGRLSPEIHPAMLTDLSCARMEYEKNTAK